MEDVEEMKRDEMYDEIQALREREATMLEMLSMMAELYSHEAQATSPTTTDDTNDEAKWMKDSAGEAEASNADDTTSKDNSYEYDYEQPMN
eukprot:scaffold430712_cov41-Prasinocladus_malaysianus.AAC.1